MIRLDTINRSLQIFLGTVQTTAAMPVTVSYSDKTSTTYNGSTQLANTNGTTPVTICSAPAAATIRDIDFINVYNADSIAKTVTIWLLDISTTYVEITVTLQPADKLTYTHATGWAVIDTSGSIKTVGNTGATGAAGPTGAQGPAIFLAAEEGEEGPIGMPGTIGRDGVTGAQGPMGPAIFLAAEDGEEQSLLVPGPVGPTGATGAAGAGTPNVIQTVLSGPVDTSGFSAFGGSTGSGTVTTSGTLIITASAGSNTHYTGSITNPSWTGLTTNGTMYLFLQITAGGAVSVASSQTLSPVYEWGGTPATTTGQYTYNIQEEKGYLGNGSAAPQVYQVCVGEVTVAGNVVTAITWYSLKGRMAFSEQLLSVATTYTFAHNLGYLQQHLKMTGWIRDVANGVIMPFCVDSDYDSSGASNNHGGSVVGSRLSAYIRTADTNLMNYKNSSGVGTAVTAANGAGLALSFNRNW